MAYRKWWYPMVHLVTTAVGVGILSFPSAMVRLGWWQGMLNLAACWIVTLHNLWKMIQLHDYSRVEGLDTYAALGRLAWGRRGWYAMTTLQIVSLVSIDIAYMVTGGYGTHLLVQGLVADPVFGVVIFGALQISVCLIPSLSELTPVSAVSMLMSLGYSALIVGAAIWMHDSWSPASYSVPKEHRVPKAFNAIGDIGFSFGGSALLSLEIQASMMSTPDRPSRIPMWHGVLASYVIIGLCYFPVAAFGYWTFGNTTCFGNVLELLERPRWLSVFANAMLVIHLTGSFQVRAIPVYDLLESSLPKLLHPSWLSRLVIRGTYIAFACFIGALMPFYTEILGLIGGLALSPAAYIMPCIVWMVVKKPEKLTPEWLVAGAWVMFGLYLSFTAIIGSIWSLQDGLSSRSHRLFHFSHKHKNCSSHVH